MREESPYRIEPCMLSNIPTKIVDQIATLSVAAQRLHQKLHPKTASSLAGIVRIMNCYYSNLIEGHSTTPREIEQALIGKLSTGKEKRDLQLEAKAHIEIQKQIDEKFALGNLPEPCSENFILWIHKEFYAEVPKSFLKIRSGSKTLTMIPGVFRSGDEEEVTIGRHIPPSSRKVKSFMDYFQKQYDFTNLGHGSRIIAMAAAHHRLNYIHPFLDGNGRVSRLMSHAMGLKSGIGAHGLWSISRGLARGLQNRQDYKNMMDYADMPRQGDLDGRGNLSLKALEEFVSWFLRVCIDQVLFMESLFNLDTLIERLKKYREIMGWKAEADYLFETILLKGDLPRGDASRITGLKERSARMLLSQLVDNGILTSDTPKGAVYISFPIDSSDVLFPRLFVVN